MMERALVSTVVTDVMKGKELLQRDAVCNGKRSGSFHRAGSREKLIHPFLRR